MSTELIDVLWGLGGIALGCIIICIIFWVRR